MASFVTDKQWRFYEENGYLILDRVAPDEQMAALGQRIDQIMMGTARIDYGKLLMQLDVGGDDYAKIGPQTKGHKGATLEYRKVQHLEFDAVFLQYMQHPIFREVCAHVYGPDAAIACHRAMFMNKPAHKGTVLPWHQDAWVCLFDPAPLLTVWTALDAATKANGCVQIIPGSHKRGIVNPQHDSGFLDDRHVREHCDERDAIDLELEAGAVALLHNWTLHRSGVNHTDAPRRAFSVNYMDASTRVLQGDHCFFVIFGDGAFTVDELESQAATTHAR